MKASIKKRLMSLLTYSYSSPREYADFGRLYPYFRFDGYSSEGKYQEWEMIEMENDYVKVWVLPAIGGKIWGAIEKATGKEFLYFNHVVKFRDVSSRGPWTSGGLEMNFGIIGHAPWCSSQVDYMMSSNDDGSVLCVVGGSDISLGTDWRVEIILYSDRAFVETKVFWFNGTNWEKPFYQWMNAGIKTSGGLKYYYPGNKYLTHDGQERPWPNEEGHDISVYDKNDFGHYKSYHVTGKVTDWWGVYWHDDDFGMVHVSPYDDKLGKKIWIWGLSRYGMVWEDLLTDSDGQYSEVQSGKLFNQSIGTSFRTPFKHCSLKPWQGFKWSEYWIPVKGTNGLSFCNTEMALNFVFYDDKVALYIYAVSCLKGKFVVESGGKKIIDTVLTMKPSEVFTVKINKDIFTVDFYRVFYNDECIMDTFIAQSTLKRPEKLPSGFNHDSVYGLFLQGQEFERQNFIDKALTFYSLSLEKDPFFVLSCNAMSRIMIQRNNLHEAEVYALRSLSVDTYDAEANLNMGFLYCLKNELADALDCFAVAMQSTVYAGVASYESAKIYLKKGFVKTALRILCKGLAEAKYSYKSHVLLSLIYKKLGRSKEAESELTSVLVTDPLNYLARYERARGNKDAVSLFVKSIVNEFSYKTFIDISLFYYSVGMVSDAIDVLLLSPKNPMVCFWIARLYYLFGNNSKAEEWIVNGDKLPVSGVFPSISDEEEVLSWVSSTGVSSWKADYYLALLYLSFSRNEEAKELLEKVGDKPDFYGFYLTRACRMYAGCEKDYHKAMSLSPSNFVCYLELAKFYIDKSCFSEAVEILERYRIYDKVNSYINLKLASAYSYIGNYKSAISLLQNSNVLPNEGSLAGRNTWKECNLAFAANLIRKKNYNEALKHISMARLWPENLGVGKPYDDMLDERLENLWEWYVKSLKGGEDNDLLKEISGFSLAKNLDSCMNAFTLLIRYKFDYNKSFSDIDFFINNDSLSLSYKWARLIYEGDFWGASCLKDEPYIMPDPLPFEVINEDRDFLIIKNNYDIIERLLEIFKING